MVEQDRLRMEKEEVRMPDGRRLVFYRFPEGAPAPQPGAPRPAGGSNPEPRER